jgi:hypothetical protein
MPRITVASLATRHVDLPAGPVLIGLFHRPEGALALVRTPSGGIVRLAAGGRLGAARVTAIGETSIFLADGGEERVLSLPV